MEHVGPKAEQGLRGAGRPPALPEADAVLAAIADTRERMTDIARRRTWKVLRHLRTAEDIDALCAAWASTRREDLASVILQRGYVATRPMRTRVLSALAADRADVLLRNARAVKPLIAALADHDPLIAQRARAALGCLRTPAGVDALCGEAVKTGRDELVRIALEAGYQPRDLPVRAALLLLAGRTEDYKEIDPEGTYLELAYNSAGDESRRRLAASARASGLARWATIVVGARDPVQLARMREDEWEAVIPLLMADARWEDMWALAQMAPVTWSRKILVLLAASNWRPSITDRPSYERLCGLVQNCPQDLPGLDSVPRCLATLRGHTASVHAVAISPNGRLLASGSHDQTVRLWQLPDGAPISKLDGHKDWVISLAISPDGRLLASAGHDKTIRLWRLPDGAPLATLKGHKDWVISLAITPDGTMLASASDDKTVRLWRLPDGAPLATLKGHTWAVHSLAITPDGTVLASASDDKTIRLWRLPDGAPLATLKGRTRWTDSLAITPDGTRLVCGSHDHTIRLWRLSGGKAAASLKGHTGSVRSLAITPDGRLLASGSNDKTIRLWRLPEATPIATLKGPMKWIHSVDVAPDGTLLASGGGDRAIRLWGSDLAAMMATPSASLVSEREHLLAIQREGILSQGARAWLDFVLALLDHHRRFDIQLEASMPLEVGEFDIHMGV